ncbi:MAG: hypothetical protein ED859_16465 [Desulfuromonadales bacterium]|nr:MAG: hypothetical protein ED859_16465 [Desulfuromonadales bacterium]
MNGRREQKSPPPILESARTLWYAVKDEEVIFTDRINLYVGEEKLCEVPCLAICENYCEPNDILLLFCDAEWNSKGAIGCKSVEEAKAKAEKGYKGISSKWVHAEASKEELDNYLREVYEVDPNSEWWTIRCSFCGQEDVVMVASEHAQICHECIKQFHQVITEKEDA